MERAIKGIKRHKIHGMDGITSDIKKTGGGVGGGGGGEGGGQIVLTYLTNIFLSL